MGLKFCSLASGSGGNCIYVASDRCRLLVDLGIPVSRVEKALDSLGVSGRQIDGIVVTHCHTDHIGSVTGFVKKYGTPVYCHPDTGDTLYGKLGASLQRKLHEISESDFFIKDITVSPFLVSHDVHCLGYSFYNAGGKVSVVTDLGHVCSLVINRLEGSDIVLIEANHDEELVKSNRSYPAHIKRRILSRQGHLSNTGCGEAIARMVKGGGIKQVILGHLSESNNTPQLALETVRDVLLKNNIEIDRDIRVAVAPPESATSLYEVSIG